MATVSEIPVFSNLSNIAARAVAALYDSAEDMFEVQSRRKMIERLNALSDAELAERGLDRDHIAHYVFRDMYYI